jgi:hypothetical protein
VRPKARTNWFVRALARCHVPRFARRCRGPFSLQALENKRSIDYF